MLFNTEDLKKEVEKPFQSVIVHFETIEDRRKFEKLLGRPITKRTKNIVYKRKRLKKES